MPVGLSGLSELGEPDRVVDLSAAAAVGSTGTALWHSSQSLLKHVKVTSVIRRAVPTPWIHGGHPRNWSSPARTWYKGVSAKLC